jgi:dTDP-N-acetylfucosamine:lipid II N-acetylfucosaminyltransferase
MIFHICPPDILFVKYCLERFENVKPGINRCIIIVSKHHLNAKHNIDNKLVDYFGPLSTNIVKRINQSDCSGVIIHTLNPDILELVLNLKVNIPIIWRSWGPDLHDVIYPDFRPLLPETEKLVSNRNNILESALSKIRPVRDFVLKKTSSPAVRLKNKIEFLNRVKFIATVTNTEYNLLLAQVQGLKAEYIHLNYRPFELKKISEQTINCDQETVLVGHSSFPYHNHADLFFQLSEYSDFTSKILVPLNYGNTIYRDKVIALGKKLFNSRATYLIDFLPFDDYINEINRCHSFILNSKVQSGGANVIYSLLHGLKVYLRKENPVYKDFIKAGIKLFSIQDELSSEHLNQHRLSDSEKKKNTKILESLFNPGKEIENVQNIYKILNITG